jgi:hypothetical protein
MTLQDLMGATDFGIDTGAEAVDYDGATSAVMDVRLAMMEELMRMKERADAVIRIMMASLHRSTERLSPALKLATTQASTSGTNSSAEITESASSGISLVSPLRDAIRKNSMGFSASSFKKLHDPNSGNTSGGTTRQVRAKSDSKHGRPKLVLEMSHLGHALSAKYGALISPLTDKSAGKKSSSSVQRQGKKYQKDALKDSSPTSTTSAKSGHSQLSHAHSWPPSLHVSASELLLANVEKTAEAILDTSYESMVGTSVAQDIMKTLHDLKEEQRKSMVGNAEAEDLLAKLIYVFSNVSRLAESLVSTRKRTLGLGN